MSGKNDTLDLVGAPLPEGIGRDAVHFSVAPVIAGQILKPGEHVGWVVEEEGKVGRSQDKLGIVDPFLPADQPIMPGTRVFLFLYPKSITNLRHIWSHPAFPEETHTVKEIWIQGPNIAESEVWLKAYARQVGIYYEELLRMAHSHVEEGWGGGLHSGDREVGEEIPAEFWRHYEVITNSQVPAKDRATYFSCAC